MKKSSYLLSGLNSVPEMSSSEAQLYYEMGVVRLELQDYEGAIDDFTRALELDPLNKWSYLHQGIAKMGITDYAGALADISQAIVINPMFSAAYYSRGLLKIELGQIDSGLLDLNKAGVLSDTKIFEGLNMSCN